ncbi:hypothetical protein GDO78_018814 [Eleutherodactylus coqui]|uniref:Taste receptor type 2 n=1 Tax=Eleutherodactylus coqui TaxID=57060 RepID=A0A8J6E6M9_ELECQ|nr:hypothetical protein GDO78_018814 [Eleutherodactylus coqui]
MAGATEGQTDVQYLGLLALALIALIAGLVIHSFIIGVNVTDWWKGRSVTPVDHIVTSLGVSRMCTQCIITLYWYMDTLFLKRSQYSHKVFIFTEAVYAFFTYANIWLTSLLSIVFCLKISNLHSRLFLYLRGVVEHRTVYFIVVTVLLSAFTSLMYFSMAMTRVLEDATYNTTMHSVYIISIYNYTSGVFFPLLFYCISSVLLFTSLYHHTSKMKMSINSSINLETYYSVMKFVFLTFICNTLYLTAHFICLFYYYFYFVQLPWLYIVLDSLPALHSSYLIYRTPKLRNWMSKILQNVTDFLTQRKDVEARENIEMVA